MTHMSFTIPGVDWQAEVAPETPTYIANPRGYLVASAAGAIVPYGAEHLVGKMGGLWFHPLRVAAGWVIRVDGVVCDAAATCVVETGAITRTHVLPHCTVTVREAMDATHPALHVWISVSREGRPVAAQVAVALRGAVEGCWFGGMDPGTTQTQVDAAGTLLRSSDSPDIAGGAAIAATPALAWQHDTDGVTGTTPHPTANVHLVIAAERDTLPAALAQALRSAEVTPAPGQPGPILTTPDADINDYWRIAQHNLGQLVARYPGMPQYALAGIPEYPQFFGCDTTYSIPGMIAAGYADVARSALDGLAERARAACGRVPHEITTNGRVFHPGNTQETPQFAVACWQYLCWTGDRAAAAAWYPVCAEGMEHVAGVLAGRHWPYGDGMVERHGMGPFKLDSVCYIAQALAALTAWARVLGRHADAEHWETARTGLLERFEAAWWLPEQQLYADSLQGDGTPQLDQHWTAIVPVQTATATPARSQQVYARVKQTLTNTWGLVHTGGSEESVWTLPTGLLALAAFDQHDGAYGVALLKNIGVTARHGSLGLLKELIPQGLCFVQLWSAGLLCQGLIEGLLGIAPDLCNGCVSITPHVPVDWQPVQLTGLVLGNSVVDITLDARTVSVVHHLGTEPLTWHVAGTKTVTESGARISFSL